MTPPVKNILSALTKQEQRKLAILIAGNVFISVLDIAALAYLLLVINGYTVSGSAQQYGFMEAIFNKGPLLPAITVLLLFLVKNMAAYGIQQVQYRYVYAVATRISEMNMFQYLEGSYTDHVQVDSAVWIRRISQQPVEFAQYVLSGLQQLITETLLIILTIAAILLFNARLFLLLLVILLPAVLLIAALARKRLKRARTMVRTDGEKALQYLREALLGFVESKLYQKNDFFAKRYAAHQQNLNRHLSDLQSIQGVSSRLMEVFAVAGLFILIVLSRLPQGMPRVDVMTLGAFMAAAYKIIPGLVKILNNSAQIRTYAFTVTGLPQPATIAPLMNQPRKANSISDISFQRVSFSRDDKTILQDLDLNMHAGEFIGITGASGRGKTTLINLLLGFLEADSGEILVNGQSTTAQQRQRYWPVIGYVKQQPFLLHDTLGLNISLAARGYDEARLKRAVTKSGLDGIDQLITENGKNISGGQRQRVAMARALYKETDVLILDEPFSELDTVSEAQLMHYLKEEADSGKIIVLITHHRKEWEGYTKTISLDGSA